MDCFEDIIFQIEAPFRTPVEVRRFRFGSLNQGPHLAIISGLHGNETGGVLAVNQLIQWLRTANITGCVDIFPIVNPVGVDQSSKLNPLDHRDINRCFPGQSSGTISERIAAAIFSEIKSCQRVISVHTGAEHVCDVTQVRCLPTDQHLFLDIGVPLLWMKEQLDGQISLLGQCQIRGQNVLYCTSGSGKSVEQQLVQRQYTVLRNILTKLGLVHSPIVESTKTIVFEGPMDEVRSNTSGFFEPHVGVGNLVGEHQSLGVVHNMYGGGVQEMIKSDYPALVSSVRVNPVVHRQELLIKLVPIQS